MNKFQSRKPVEVHARRLPVIEVRPRDLVAIVLNKVGASGERTTGALLAETPGEAARAAQGEVVRAYHSAHGVMNIAVKHDRASHPAGVEIFEVKAEGKLMIWRAA